jgi:hypothetical protein
VMRETLAVRGIRISSCQKIMCVVNVLRVNV